LKEQKDNINEYINSINYFGDLNKSNHQTEEYLNSLSKETRDNELIKFVISVVDSIEKSII
jgi:hypothetical protein